MCDVCVSIKKTHNFTFVDIVLPTNTSKPNHSYIWLKKKCKHFYFNDQNTQ